MFLNFFKIAFRNLRKRKGFAALNIFGLSVAIAVSLLLFTTAFQELSFDRFHKNADNLYVLYHQENRQEGIEKGDGMPMPLVPALKEEFPDIVEGVRVQDNGGVIEYDGKTFNYGIDLADPAFFKMFSFPIAEGNKENPLPGPSSLVITKKTAKAIFGDENPLGKTVKWKRSGRETLLTVTAIAEDPPYHSSLRFELLGRIENADSFKDPSWGNYNHQAYVQLPPSVKPEEMEERFREFTRKHRAEDIEMMKRNGFLPDEKGDVLRLRLLPLKSFHFATDLSANAIKRMFPIGLLIIGFFVLAIACINFVNLTIGTSIVRSLEVGVRKVLGAGRAQVAVQFWSEALLVVLIAGGIGLMLVQWVLPRYNAMFRQDIGIGSPFLLASLAGILLLTGLLAGGYPAMILSKFQAAQVLKRANKLQFPGVVRNLLVTVQFVISITLIACTMVVLQQFDYLRNKPLGYNKSEVVSIPVGNDIRGEKAVELMRNELAGYPDVRSVSASMRNLGMGTDGSIITSILGWDQKGKSLHAYWLGADYGYVETLDIELLEGKTFDPNRPIDTAKVQVIINETLAKDLAAQPSENFRAEAVGQILETDPKSEVVGVVKDFHFNPLDKPIEPMALVLDRSWGLNYIFVKIAPQNMPKTMAHLEEVWKKIAPRTEFKGSFLDENTDRQYKREEMLSQIFAAAGGLTILLSCLGLFAIAVLTIVQRTKEIGIRKVLGASVAGLAGLLAKDFLKWVGIAAIVAIPLAWYGMKEWLQNYHYRIELHWWVFLAAGAVAVAVALLTVSFQSVKAALTNPVKSLRSE